MKYFVYCRKSSESEDRQILSIDSQQDELERAFAGRQDMEIVEVFKESFSAKAPGRPIFDEMLRRIERGHAGGVIAWHPDRLARNSIDGGRIIYLLDKGIIKDIKFSTFTFENNSQGKFMLSIIFGYSKYYVDSLSENVKRGNRAKLERGWRPNQAPLGYINDKETKTIITDPVHLPLVRKMYDLMLTGTHSPKQIALIARDKWAFRTPQKKRTGGKPLAMSTVYKILTNPFYAGILVWANETYPGKHEPVITIDEFQRVQELLGRPGRARSKRHYFPFTGMIRCESCGLMVTAEHKINRFGSRYIYYHCTNRRMGPRCAERAIEARDLDSQIYRFLGELAMPESIFQVVEARANDPKENRIAEHGAQRYSLETALEGITKELSELTTLRLRNILTDEEFVAKRQELKQTEIRLHQQVEKMADDKDEFEPIGDFILLRKRATDWFRHGSPQTKKQILHVTGSNLSLGNKMLNIDARKPFRQMRQHISYSQQLAFINDVRTWVRENRDEARRLSTIIKDLAKEATSEKKAA
jgi:site-specific DNA recombinase